MDKTVIFDLRHKEFPEIQRIDLTQGEARTVTLQIRIMLDGQAFDLTGSQMLFLAELPGGKHAIGECEITNAEAGEAVYIVDGSVSASPGLITMAYLRIEKGDELYTTDCLTIDVGRAIDISGPEAEHWIGLFGDLKAKFEEVIAASGEQKDAQQAGWLEQMDGQKAGWLAQMDGQAEAFDASQAERDASQAKNNADQLNNNLMAQASRYVTLDSDQWDHETGAPTIDDPQQGMTYLVPIPQADTLNNYNGWVWLLNEDGSGEWELIGPANPTPDPVTTGDVDAALSGAGKSGMRYVALNALNYFAARIKTMFAPLSHKHDGADLLDGTITAPKLGDKMIPTYTVSSETEPVSVTPCLRIVVDESGNMQQMLFDSGGGS